MDIRLPDFNLNSGKMLSALFFGGLIPVETVEPVLTADGNIDVYKTGDRKGQVKCKKVVKEVYVRGLELKPLDNWKTKNEGVYQTNKSVLMLLAGEKDVD